MQENTRTCSILNTVHVYKPPILVESAVTKAQQLSNDVQAGMEHPVEKYQPQEMIRHLTITETEHDNTLYHTIRSK